VIKSVVSVIPTHLETRTSTHSTAAEEHRIHELLGLVFIVSEKGYILTNFHVIADQTRLRCFMAMEFVPS
jgi:S1-C subfamily serine protease